MHAEAHYLIGIPDCNGAPPSISVPRIYDTAADAEADLGVIMMLCRLTHGDMAVESSSWYLQSASVYRTAPTNAAEFYGYILDGVVYPVAGAWDERRIALWEPFVGEFERQHARDARMPWSSSMLKKLRLCEFAGVEDIEMGYFRFAPLHSQLLVRPLNLYVTEPLF